jgi:hemolysin activation/secretion protein
VFEDRRYGLDQKLQAFSAARAIDRFVFRCHTPRGAQFLCVKLLLIGLSAGGWSALSFAQSASEAEQRSLDVYRRQQAREQDQRQRLEAAPDVKLSQPGSEPIARLPRNESPCFPIRSIELIGPDSPNPVTPIQALPPGWREELLSELDAGALIDSEGRPVAARAEADSPLFERSGICLGLQGINILQQRVQAHLLARGFITSRALVEPQDLSTGHLRMRVLAGRIYTIRLPQSPAPQSAAQAASVVEAEPEAMPARMRRTLITASPARAGDVLQLRDLEQTMENLKRVPTVEADIRIEPASKPGYSDWVVTHQQGFPLRFTLTADDGGTPSTGLYQGSATVSWDAPLGLNDLFYVTFNHDLGGGDPESRGTRGHALHYSLPWGYWTLGYTQSASRYYQTVAGTNLSYVYSGTSENHELKATRIVLRDATSKTSAYVKGFQRRSNNFIDDNEMQLQKRLVGGWEFGAAHRAYWGTTVIDASYGYKVGSDFLVDTAPAPEEALGTGTSRFALTLTEINVTQPWSGKPWLSSSTWQGRYTSLLRTQNNHTSLTPQDRFSIGGRYTVRGFDGVSVLSAERGVLWRNECSLALGSSGAETYLGVDWGYVDGMSADTLAGKQLIGSVLGLRGMWTQKLNYEIFIGTPLEKPASLRTAPATAGFSLVLTL